MTVRDIYAYIDSFAPFESAAEWDNSGLLVGSFDSSVTKAVVCLDVTDKVIDFTIKNAAELIISHHPVIFSPQKNFLSNSLPYKAAVNGISIISAHTNLDKAVDGVNDTLCKVLSLNSIKCPPDVCEGFLNICELNREMASTEFADLLKTKLSASVRFCGADRYIKKVGVCSGAGHSFVTEAATLGCDAFLTGDASYHDFLDAYTLGVSLFAAGHYETEIPVVPSLSQKLQMKFNETAFLPYIAENVVNTVK